MRNRAITRSSLRAAALSLFLMGIALPLRANPFMGAGNGPNGAPSQAVSPVRAAPAEARLLDGQASLRERLGNFFYAWKETGDRRVLWGILGAAFLYGVLHALGPGHRKTVIFSLYIARDAPIGEPAGTGILLSALHGGTAVALLLAFRGVSGAISGKADNVAAYMEGAAYVLLIAIASVLVFRAIRDLARGHPRSANGAASLGTILLTGAYPCPGAILILILSLSLDIAGVGVLAVFAMSLGMGIPIVAVGYLAWFGRTGLFRALKANERLIGRISSIMELVGYSILLAFSAYMAEPFILSLARIAGARFLR